MSVQKPSIPKGTRDFSPEVMVRRNYIFNTIREVFHLYGYQPIETPAMENLSSLLGKYGEEGDKLLFKVLNSGDFLKKAQIKSTLGDLKEKVSSDLDNLTWENLGVVPNELVSSISEKGLRYDLTVPFARYVVQHRNEITFPFKRYQVQPVWRADRPQKGRYREFYQCDVDVVGSDSLLNEVEFVQIIDKVFTKLNLKVLIKLNNRKILAGIAESIGAADKMIDITVAMDKLDKIGLENVNQELSERGLSDKSIQKLQPVFGLSGDTKNRLKGIKDFLGQSEVGLIGVEEVETVFSNLENLSLKTEIELDLTLARGLSYYTGAIFEVKAKDVEIGSICGGGRYDNLTGVFGMDGVSGVGISFGADRIYDVMSQLNLFPEEAVSSTKVMFVNFGDKEASYCLLALSKLRESGISAELYPDSVKMKKQMSYANNKGVAYVVLVGEEEMNKSTLTVKNMESGEQESISIDELVKKLS